MDIASIVILLFIVIFAVVGFFKGFIKIFLNVCKGLAMILISFFLAKPVGGIIYNTGLGNTISQNIESVLIEKVDVTRVIVTETNKGAIITEALNGLNIPEFLQGLLTNGIEKLIGNVEGKSLAYYIGHTTANIACSLIAFIALSIIIFIVFCLLRRIFKTIEKLPVINIVNRLLGCFLNVAFAWVIVSAVLWVVSFLSITFPVVADFSNDLFMLGTDKQTVARWFYENNLLVKLFTFFSK